MAHDDVEAAASQPLTIMFGMKRKIFSCTGSSSAGWVMGGLAMPFPLLRASAFMATLASRLGSGSGLPGRFLVLGPDMMFAISRVDQPPARRVSGYDAAKKSNRRRVAKLSGTAGQKGEDGLSHERRATARSCSMQACE